jgi:hypothetical protein
MTETIVTLQTFEIIILTVSFGAVLLGLITTRRHFSILRTLSFVERFNSETGIKLRTRIDTWLEQPDAEQRLQDFLHDPELRVQVLAFLNQFQELGAAYRNRLLNRKLVMEMFDFLVPHYWQNLCFLIEHYQHTTGDPHVYRSFRLIAEDIRRRKAA